MKRPDIIVNCVVIFFWRCSFQITLYFFHENKISYHFHCEAIFLILITNLVTWNDTKTCRAFNQARPRETNCGNFFIKFFQNISQRRLDETFVLVSMYATTVYKTIRSSFCKIQLKRYSNIFSTQLKPRRTNFSLVNGIFYIRWKPSHVYHFIGYVT